MDRPEELKALRKDEDKEKESSSSSTSSSDHSVSIEYDIDNVKRGEWGSKVQFFLAIMGYTVGIGSVWRFPIICSRNGGGAFLIPFFTLLIISGGPLYYLEVCLGQFTGQSAGFSFEYCPLFKGIGLLQVILSLIVLWYIMTILAWTFYMLYCSFFPILPWTTCGNEWNTVNCRGLEEIWKAAQEAKLQNGSAAIIANGSSLLYNVTYNVTTSATVAAPKIQSSAFEFWEYNVIGRSVGLEDMGSLQPHLVIGLFLANLFCVLAVIKGVQSLGKVVYVTATAPFLLLTVMFIRGLTLEGAMEGVRVYLTPDFSKLLSIQVWLEAAVQVFYSLGPSWGGVITMASYNNFHQKSFWPSTICVMFAGFTSFYNGLVVFTIIGFMANQLGMSVQEVATQSGPGLAFVAFPTAISQMPLPQLWAVLFFLTLVTVVFDSLFGMLETVTSGIIDLFPKQLTSKRMLVNIFTGLGFFVTGLPLTMNGGIYIFQLSDWYFSQFALLISSFLECVSICWIYGTDRFARDISLMFGRDVSAVLRCVWSIVIPVLVTLIFFTLLTRYSTPAYGDGYVYGPAAIAVGNFVGLLPVIALIIVGIVAVVRSKGTFMQRLRSSLRPSPRWQPNDPATRENYRYKSYIEANTLCARIRTNLRGDKNTPLF